ncbi:MAG: hypothetical protein WAV00_13005 [Nocardioides sp.]
MDADHTPRLPRHWTDPEVFETTQASFDLSADSDRLIHLVLVDGRLVEAWGERSRGAGGSTTPSGATANDDR